MRPICPDVRTESSSSGKFIAEFLQPFVQKIPSYLGNSYELIGKLSRISKLPDSAVLLTVDIESLYPSIPVQDALDTVKDLLLYSNNSDQEMVELIISLLDIQLRNNFFDFDGAHYRQIRGVPMGKPWAPAVACLYLLKWDCDVMAKLTSPPVLFCRYIDDVLMIFQTRHDAETCLAVMRAANVNIKVGDSQIGSSVHFLDLNIEVNPRRHAALRGSCFATHIFRKSCDLRVILHMQSAHDYSVKFGTVFSQVVRIWRLCSDKRAACQQIAEFIQCMRTFRGLRPRTIRKLTNKFLSWVCREYVAGFSDPRVLAPKRMASYTKHTLCMLPREVSRQRVNCALRDITDRLTDSERAYVGDMRFRNITSTRLIQQFT